MKTAAYLGDYVREENPPFQHIYGKTVMEYFTDVSVVYIEFYMLLLKGFGVLISDFLEKIKIAE